MEKIYKYVGVVYKRTLIKDCPEKGYTYIGYSLNMTKRNQSWNSKANKRYGGKKIQEAREKYSDLKNDWTVEELVTIPGNQKNRTKKKCKEKEKEFIAIYDSIEHGFNQSKEGGGHYAHTKEQFDKMVATRRLRGNYKHSAKSKAKMSRKHKGKPHPLSDRGKANIASAHYRIVVIVTDAQGNETHYPSKKDAAIALGISMTTVSNYLLSSKTTKQGYRFATPTTNNSAA